MLADREALRRRIEEIRQPSVNDVIAAARYGVEPPLLWGNPTGMVYSERYSIVKKIRLKWF